jgi:hypothetical protein
LEVATTFVREGFKRSCGDWIASLNPAELQYAARSALDLVRGLLTWEPIKGIYDIGLVYQYAANLNFRVRPVSAPAGAIIMAQLAPLYNKPPLASIKKEDEKGHEFTKQIIYGLARSTSVTISTKDIYGAASKLVTVSGAPVHTFKKFPETAHNKIDTVAYVNESHQYEFDAIVVTSDSSAPLVIIESSVTEPNDTRRVQKIQRWFAPGEVIDQLQVVHPKRRIQIVLCWHGYYRDRSQGEGNESVKKLSYTAKAKKVYLLVADEGEVGKLGVVL